MTANEFITNLDSLLMEYSKINGVVVTEVILNPDIITLARGNISLVGYDVSFNCRAIDIMGDVNFNSRIIDGLYDDKLPD